MQSNTRELLQYLRYMRWLKGILISEIKTHPVHVKFKLIVGKKEGSCQKKNKIVLLKKVLKLSIP